MFQNTPECTPSTVSVSVFCSFVGSALSFFNSACACVIVLEHVVF